MRNIRRSLIPAFVFGHALVAIVHLIGFILLYRVKFRPVNQRLLLLNLSFTELCIGLSQSIVYSILLFDCDADCDLTDTFFNASLHILNKAIMIYLICDRALEICLNIKYPLYFNEERTKKVLACMWVLSVAFVLILVLLLKFGTNLEKYVYMTLAGIVLGEDALVCVAAISTSFYFYIKVKSLLRIDDYHKKYKLT